MLDYSSPSAFEASKLRAGFADRIRTKYFWAKHLWALTVQGRHIDPSPVANKRWDGDPMRSKPSVWDAAARICIEQDLDPDALVAALFSGLKPVCPSPEHLTAAPTVDKCKARQGEAWGKVRLDLDTQKNDALTALNRIRVLYNKPVNEAWKDVLLSDSVHLSSLFKYASAVTSGFTDLADTWLDAALEQYMCARAIYDSVWGDLIPQELKDKANALSIRG